MIVVSGYWFYFDSKICQGFLYNILGMMLGIFKIYILSNKPEEGALLSKTLYITSDVLSHCVSLCK